ncbi:MAG: LysM peptidoglycan-binding domain-containing protein [Planctomycetes bacterium]|nr:LysM peptidoglycan-binding domain-containing protein [Planctomycetota bacterium]
MTRESKIALLVGLAFIVCFGVILSGTRSDVQTPAVAAVDVPVDSGFALESRRPASLTALPPLPPVHRPQHAGRPSIVLADDLPVQPDAPVRPAEVSPVRVAPPTDRTYTVQPRDTLSLIARRVYGTEDRGAYMRIFDANRDILRDPSSVRAGQVLRIPPADAQAPEATVRATEAAGTYVVQPNDTLIRIARKTMNSDDRQAVRRLYELNRQELSDPDHLRIGQTLRIPR